MPSTDPLTVRTDKGGNPVVKPMKISTRLRRSAAAILLAAGLAYPACAAVCPKGIGGCPSPGRCFLFTDADANALCDYTGRNMVQAPTPAPAAAPVQVTAPPTAAATAAPASPVSAPVTTVPATTAVPGDYHRTGHPESPLRGFSRIPADLRTDWPG